jgi:hypothetical protein
MAKQKKATGQKASESEYEQQKREPFRSAVERASKTTKKGAKNTSTGTAGGKTPTM